jgi:metallophosphoesterase (TIGR03767 family)
VRTDRAALRRSGGPGYRTLHIGAGEPHLLRTELADTLPRDAEALVTIAHLSDLHVCDAQSPARVEYLDRWADPDSPIVEKVGNVGTYRAQESMTMHVVEAMVQAVNAVDAGPVAAHGIDLAVVTGDNTDNAQANELDWYVRLLDGGPLVPDSGDRTMWEGIAALGADERFWHAEGDVRDLPRQRYGFPSVGGLGDAVRRGFDATGLRVPWLAVHGNHDRMLQGTVPANAALGEVAVGAVKAIGLPASWSSDEIAALLVGLAACDPAALARLREARTVPVTADAARRFVSRAEFVAAHFAANARPAGHGFTPANRAAGTAYYRYDAGETTVLVLDTVDAHGGWEGSLDREQFGWLREELSAADAERRHVVLASHHPLVHLVNATGPDRVLGAELAAELDGHPSLVLWLNGHSHRSTVWPRQGFWEVTTPSLIDWPQQGRIVELLRGSSGLVVAATMLDHAGDAPWSGTIDSPAALAGLSRELAANDWQDVVGEPAGGTLDRNVLLPLSDPFRR